MSLKLDELRKRLLQGQASEQNDDEQPRVLSYSTRHEAASPASAGEEIASAPPPAPVSAPQPEPQVPPPATPRQTRPRAAATPISASEPQLSEAVAKVFEQTEGLQSQLNELRAMFEPIERVGKAAAEIGRASCRERV